MRDLLCGYFRLCRAQTRKTDVNGSAAGPGYAVGWKQLNKRHNGVQTVVESKERIPQGWHELRDEGALYTELSQEQDVRHTAILTVPLIVVRKKKAPFGVVELPAVFGVPMKFNRGSRNLPRRNPLFKQSKL